MNQKGQVLPMVAALSLVLVLFWMIIVDAGYLIREKIRLQTAADAAALSGARWMARGLNLIGSFNNYLILTGYPYLTNENLRGVVEGILRAQDGFKVIFSDIGVYGVAAQIARRNGADFLVPAQLPKGLLIKRNRGLVIYGQVIPEPPFFIPTEINPDAERWYCRDWQPKRYPKLKSPGWAKPVLKQQPPHRIRVIAFKSLRDLPVGGKLLRWRLPFVLTIAEAQVSLDVPAGIEFLPATYNGGLPPLDSSYEDSRWPLFGARLVPVAGKLYH